MNREPNENFDRMCSNCIYWHKDSGKCLSGDSLYYEQIRPSIFVCNNWSDHYIYPLTGKETIVKLCSSCYHWHTGHGGCTNEESRYHKKIVQPHFKCTEWKHDPLCKPRQVKHLPPETIIKSQKDNILAQKGTIKIKDEIIEQLRKQISQQKAVIHKDISIANIHQNLKEKHRNVQYMNKELLKIIREWGGEE